MNDNNARCRPGVIFDLDGTLVDTLDDITDSINVVLGESGLAPVSREAIRGLLGRGISILVEDILAEADRHLVSRLVAAFQSVYASRMLRTSRLYPGVPEVLNHLGNLRMPMAVLSNKPEEFTSSMCEALLRPWPFAGWRGAGGADQRKPDPRGALALAEAMGSQACDVYLVGDSTIDIQTARNAGMKSIAVTWGYKDRAELAAAMPEWLVNNPPELLGILAGRNGARA